MPKFPRRCRAYAEEIVRSTDRQMTPSPRLEAHLATCLSCRLEFLRYRRLMNTLAELRQDVALLPEGLLASIFARVAQATARGVDRAAGRRRSFPAIVAFSLLGLAATVLSVIVRSRSGSRGNSHTESSGLGAEE